MFSVKEKNIARFEKIDRSMTEGVYLYGAGMNGRWCLDYLQRVHIKVIAFIDSNCKNWHKQIDGIEVIGYKEYQKREQLPILVTAKHAVTEIMQNIETDMMMSFDAWFLMKHKNAYKQICFDDEEGSKVLRAICNCMICGNKDALREIVCTEQYFWGYPYYNMGGEIFVDLGACTGDTIEKFIWANNGLYEHIYAFEPGEKQCQAARIRKKRLVKEWALDDESITIEQQIVDECSGSKLLDDSTELLATNYVTAGGDNSKEVPSVSLDSYFADKRVTFIKADIEGSEYAALMGAKEVLQRDKPKLAICVYHKPDDLLRIYHFLKELVPEYQFTLRHHSSKLVDTVLYCWIS